MTPDRWNATTLAERKRVLLALGINKTWSSEGWASLPRKVQEKVATKEDGWGK